VSNQPPPGYTPKSKAKLNLKLDMQALKLFLTTGRGWVLRQASVIGQTAGAGAAGYIAAIANQAGATADQAAQAATATNSLVAVSIAVVVNLGLSWLAAKANQELPPPAK
jgi:hypothetical protein